MPKRQPAYRRHSTRTHLAFVQIAGKRIMLGLYDSPESWERYHSLLAQRQRTIQPQIGSPSGIVSVASLVAKFWPSAKQRYVKNGQPTSEQHLYKLALRPLLDLHARTPVESFTPAHLLEVREQMVRRGIVRRKINQHISRIRRVFQWGVQRQLVPVTTWQALKAVEGLRKGEAVERPKVALVPRSLVDAIEPFVSRPVWAMIQFQLLTGCRPGEVCSLRWCDIDRSKPIWLCRPESHKTEHYDVERVIAIGPQAQRLLARWLNVDLTAYVFSPQVGRLDYLDRATRNPAKRHRGIALPKSKRKPRNRYDASSYAGAIKRACLKAFPVPDGFDAEQASQWRKAHHWSPNQLRHTAASRIRSECGIEMSRVVLGHRSAVTSEIYAEIDWEKASQVMSRLG